MITTEQYFGKFMDHSDVTTTVKVNAAELLESCHRLETMARSDEVIFLTNPATKSNISGTQYGGFRPQDCPIGAPGSSHKQGKAVDRYDPDGKIDAWCLVNQDKLKECGIYIEHPNATASWSHWTTRAPGSGNRVFYP